MGAIDTELSLLGEWDYANASDNNFGAEEYPDVTAFDLESVSTVQAALQSNVPEDLPGRYNTLQHGRSYVPGYGLPDIMPSERLAVHQIEANQSSQRHGSAISHQSQGPASSVHAPMFSGGPSEHRCMCGKSYQRKQELTRHIKEKTGAPKYSCEFEDCDYTCHEKKALDRHYGTKKHTSSAPRFFCEVEVCPYSTKGFSRRDNCTRHMENKHNMKIQREDG